MLFGDRTCRDQGRAAGGLADLIRTYAQDEAYPCDAELEALAAVATRARLRRKLRRADPNDPAEIIALAGAFGVRAEMVERTLRLSAFGERWITLEEASPHLVRERILPAQLPSYIAQAEDLLLKLDPSFAARRASAARHAGAGLWSVEIDADRHIQH